MPLTRKAVTFVFCQTARSSRKTTAIFVSNCIALTRRASTLTHHDELVDAGFGAPDLTPPTEKLAHVGRRARQAHRGEPCGARVEADQRVGAEVAEPHDVARIDEDRIRLRARARELPFAPAAPPRIEHPELAGVPLAHPDPAARVRPDTARTLAAGRRAQNRRLSRADVDPTHVAPRERRVVDGAAGRGRDPVRARAPRRVERPYPPDLRIEPPVHAALAGEPEDALSVEGRRVEIRERASTREREAPDAQRSRVDADDGVQAAVRDPRSAVGPDDHAVRRRTVAEMCLPGASGVRVEPAEVTRALRRVPYSAVALGRHVVR